MLAPRKGGEEDNEDHNRYPREPPQLPQYDISPNLKKLTLMFIGAMLINFVIAGICPLGMRIIQKNAAIIIPVTAADLGAVDSP